ncbi:MAG TPA: glycoside hydrolase family 97 protein [Opitutaceae bacterium]|nr:glycoside hydrolase family 97 protein [Opitutaceae bacterium]
MNHKSHSSAPSARRAAGGLLVIAACLFSNGPVRADSGLAALTSPDGQLAISFQIQTDQSSAAGAGQLTYSVTFHGKPVIMTSALGLELQSQQTLGAEVTLVGTTTATVDETYRLMAGKASVVRDHCNALTLALAEPPDQGGRTFNLEARAYDDAVAFRYVIPQQKKISELHLANEATEFRLPNDATSYALVLPNFRSMYESEFLKLPVSAFSNQGGVASNVLIGLPTLLELPGTAWVAITEADLQGYAAMYLTNPSASWTGHWLQCRLAPQVEDPSMCVTGTLPRHSGWRVLLVADDPGRLIESNVITSLNPASAVKDTSWIQPGKAAWDWWGGSRGADHQSAYTTETMKYYVDFAAKSGFPYMLVDAGWFVKGDITKMNGKVDIPEVVRYAATKGVKIWIWAGYADLNRQMDEAFALYEKWGVAGVKTDFIERDDQAGIEFYYRTAEEAAQHHLMMDYHGASKPWGMERTWPNVLGYEAVAGMEQSKAGARDNPDHHVTLPFTRMLAGPMDYTPGGFDNVTREQFVPRMDQPMVMGTRSHQLAMYVVYQAAFQMVSDWPGNYEGQPAFSFIKDVPTVWDETHVLNGRPGEFVTIARRHGGEWFLGSMTNWTPRELDLPLSFLGDGHYTAEIYADAADADRAPKNVAISKQTVDRSSHLIARLAPGGGYAVRFSPAP